MLYAEPLGLNGAVLAVFTNITWSLYERLRMFSALQQARILFCLLLLAQFVRMLGLMLLIERELQFGFVVIALASALLWPVARWALERVQFGARVI